MTICPIASGRAATAPARTARRRGGVATASTYLFCVDHVRQYNASYNYFDGMSDSEVEDFQKDALTGHRPTWKVGANAWAHGTRARAAARAGPVGRRRPSPGPARVLCMARQAGSPGTGGESPAHCRPLERKSLEALNLTAAANKR